MTCKEFDSKYPDVAESANDASQERLYEKKSDPK